MKLYHVQDSDDGPKWVLAESWDEAITKWRAAIAKENPEVDCSGEQPHSITVVCEGDELVM